MFNQTGSAINTMSASISPIITVSTSVPPMLSLSMSPMISPSVSPMISPSVSSIITVSASVSPITISPSESPVAHILPVSPTPIGSLSNTVSPTKSPNPSASRSPIVNNSTILYNISNENAGIIFAILLGAFLVNLVCSITWYRKYKQQKAKNKLPVKFPTNPLHSSVRTIFT